MLCARLELCAPLVVQVWCARGDVAWLPADLRCYSPLATVIAVQGCPCHFLSPPSSKVSILFNHVAIVLAT